MRCVVLQGIPGGKIKNMTTLENLYYGNLRPMEKQYDRDSSYAEYRRAFSEREHRLTAWLEEHAGEEPRRLFAEMLQAGSELALFEERERFFEGFRLGAGLMVDALVLPDRSVLRDIE